MKRLPKVKPFLRKGMMNDECLMMNYAFIYHSALIIYHLSLSKSGSHVDKEAVFAFAVEGIFES